MKSARTRLYKAIENDEHLTGGKGSAGGIETDRAQLADLVATMTVNPNSHLSPYYMLRSHDFGGGSFYLSALDPYTNSPIAVLSMSLSMTNWRGYVLPSSKLRASSCRLSANTRIHWGAPTAVWCSGMRSENTPTPP